MSTFQERPVSLPQGEQVTLIGVLKGAAIFLSDLSRNINLDATFDFISCSSYGKGARSIGEVKLIKDLDQSVQDKNVILVEDIIDSGHTLKSVLDILSIRQPKSLKVCTLLDKSERREVPIPVRYRGFSIPNKFVFGYGLDLDEYYRNLRFVGVVDLEKYKPPS